jgi:arylsulfatase A
VPLRAEGAKIRKYQARLAAAHATLPDPIYAAMIEDLDDLVGRVMVKLDELQLAESTLLIFVSDNGGLEHLDLGLDRLVTSNAPLRAEKGTIYEGGIRVPLIARWPSFIGKGGVQGTAATLADLLPTFLDLAGAPPSERGNFDGRSLAGLLKGRTGDLANRPLYIHYPHYHHGRPASAVILGRWKLIEFLDDGALELYDVVSDIGESRDQSRRHPQTTSKLKRMLESWRREAGARMPVPNPDYDASKAAQWWEFESKQPISLDRYRKLLAPGEFPVSPARHH